MKNLVNATYSKQIVHAHILQFPGVSVGYNQTTRIMQEV